MPTNPPAANGSKALGDIFQDKFSDNTASDETSATFAPSRYETDAAKIFKRFANCTRINNIIIYASFNSLLN